MILRAHIRHYLRAVEHRILRRRLWKWFFLPKLRRMDSRKLLHRLGPAASPVALLELYRTNLSTRLLFHARNRKDFFTHLITASQSMDSVLEEAQAVLENRFQTLGSPLVSLGDRINWQRDFKSGQEWPLEPSQSLDFLQLDRPSDVKVPWELGRFHQTWWLGKAYWGSSNEQFAAAFGRLVEDWIDQNPPGLGVQWSLAMEASIRACNWICGFSFFCESKSLSAEFWTKFFSSLYAHGLFIWHNREYALRNGNHYLSNIVGLIYLGVFFQNTREGKQWLAWGVRELEREMRQQVSEDGVDYEKSTGYHRLVLELFTAAAVLCRMNKRTLKPSFWARLEKMYEFVLHYLRPDGSAPMIGDADDGRLFRFRLTEPINDHRHMLSVGAVLFERGDFKQAAASFSQDAVFLLGAEGFERFLKIRGLDPPRTSQRFPCGGFVIMRSPDVHIIADVGDLGMDGRGGHGHNDTLSFDLWARGAPLIVDPGTYVYTADAEARQLFRSTRMHNTAMVGGREIAEFHGLWQVTEDRTRPRVLRWETSSSQDILEAEHSGYLRLSPPVLHRRRFSLTKEPFCLEILDSFSGEAPTPAELYFHVHPDLTVSALDGTGWILQASGFALKAVFSHIVVRRESWYSPSYGLRTPSAVLCLALDVNANELVRSRFTFQ